MKEKSLTTLLKETADTTSLTIKKDKATAARSFYATYKRKKHPDGSKLLQKQVALYFHISPKRMSIVIKTLDK